MLNQGQRTALTTSLLHLEQALDEIDHLLDHPPSGVTYTTEVEFGPATAQQIREKCDQLRRQITDAVAAFNLPRHHWSGRRVIVAEMSTAWANLEDMRPAKLRRYGTVDPALNEILTPRLEDLIHLVLTVQELATKGR